MKDLIFHIYSWFSPGSPYCKEIFHTQFLLNTGRPFGGNHDHFYMQNILNIYKSFIKLYNETIIYFGSTEFL